MPLFKVRNITISYVRHFVAGWMHHLWQHWSAIAANGSIQWFFGSLRRRSDNMLLRVGNGRTSLTRFTARLFLGPVNFGIEDMACIPWLRWKRRGLLFAAAKTRRTTRETLEASDSSGWSFAGAGTERPGQGLVTRISSHWCLLN